eukprot:SAG22_NODE_748_length_7489_cov_39.991070_2_plen_131_part_00
MELSYNQITDLAPLSALTSLTTLDLCYNQITDIAPLSALTSLTTLWLDNNQITDIAPLSALTSLAWIIKFINPPFHISHLCPRTLSWFHRIHVWTDNSWCPCQSILNDWGIHKRLNLLCSEVVNLQQVLA